MDDITEKMWQQLNKTDRLVDLLLSVAGDVSISSTSEKVLSHHAHNLQILAFFLLISCCLRTMQSKYMTQY